MNLDIYLCPSADAPKWNDRTDYRNQHGDSDGAKPESRVEKDKDYTARTNERPIFVAKPVKAGIGRVGFRRQNKALCLSGSPSALRARASTVDPPRRRAACVIFG